MNGKTALFALVGTLCALTATGCDGDDAPGNPGWRVDAVYELGAIDRYEVEVAGEAAIVDVTPIEDAVHVTVTSRASGDALTGLAVDGERVVVDETGASLEVDRTDPMQDLVCEALEHGALPVEDEFRLGFPQLPHAPGLPQLDDDDDDVAWCLYICDEARKNCETANALQILDISPHYPCDLLHSICVDDCFAEAE